MKSILRLGLLGLALGAAGCGNSTESAPLATRSSGPIAFLRGEGTKPDPTTGIEPLKELVVTDSEGGNERTILTPRYDVESFSWSPDGRQLVFAALRPSGPDNPIYVVNADGSGLHKIRGVPSNLSSPSWSPRGDLIVFDEQDDGYHEVWVIKPDGSGAHRLATDVAGPAIWSPDGRKLAYSVFTGVSSSWTYLMNPDGSEKRKFTRHGGGDWTPLGMSYRDGRGIGFVEPDGSAGKLEIRVGDEWQRYRLSPDGRTVALEGPIVPIGDWEIALARIGGGKLQRLTDNDRQDVFTSFSPDGKSLAFEVVPIAKDADRPQRDIYVINADGSGERNLTDSAVDESSPAWAPSG